MQRRFSKNKQNERADQISAAVIHKDIQFE